MRYFLGGFLALVIVGTCTLVRGGLRNGWELIGTGVGCLIVGIALRVGFFMWMHYQEGRLQHWWWFR